MNEAGTLSTTPAWAVVLGHNCRAFGWKIPD
jgi:hypothetical protein